MMIPKRRIGILNENFAPEILWNRYNNVKCFCKNDFLCLLFQTLRGRCMKKSKKKLTSVSFAFTHTYTLKKLTLLLFSPKRTWKILNNESIAV